MKPLIIAGLILLAGLQLKCKALGITTITLKAFLKQLKH